ncbi:MAG: isochorismatase family protein [Planctomycetota bacterium]
MTDVTHVVSHDRLQAVRSAILVIDLQEKLVPVIPSGEKVVFFTDQLLDAADLLQVPAAATVQYPRGLGSLVEPLAGRFPEAEEKLDFSSAVCRRDLERWQSQGRDQIVVCGIETHICVLQTVLDLNAEGFDVHVIEQAVAARGPQEHTLAIEQMRCSGATITSVESVVFQWLGSAKHPQFKAVSKLVQSMAARQ